MEYEIINGVVIDNKGRQFKHYSEVPYGFGHFLSGDISSLEGMTTATSFGKGDKHKICPSKKDENNFG